MTTTKGKGDDKGPVEVEELVTRSELFIEQNSKKIIFGIIAVAVLVAAILGYKYGYATPQQKKAEAAMFRAELYFDRDSFALALNGDGLNVEGFNAIIDQYGSTDAGNLAKAYAGICYFKLGDNESALDMLKSFSASDKMLSPTIVGLIVAVYWLLMFVGRSIGGAIGDKISSKTMLSIVSTASVVLIALGMFAPTDVMVQVPGIDWANLSMIWAEVPVGIFAFLLVGLCTSVMWGSIFNLAVEGLGKYTSIASGAFMTMVFGCAVMVALQAWVADVTGSFLTSYFVVLFCAAYLLFYALVGSKNVNKDIPVE